tara:strand:+ start:146 stop:418 length:273 start_codon:yes stop_codon:yes gene_type:complete
VINNYGEQDLSIEGIYSPSQNPARTQATPEHLNTLDNKHPDRITLRKRQANLNNPKQNHIKKARRAIAVVFYTKRAHPRFQMKTNQLVNQ